MNKEKLTRSIRINLISSSIMISVFIIIWLIFFAFRKTTGNWPLEIWGVITILISLIYSFVYQIAGRFNKEDNETGAVVS